MAQSWDDAGQSPAAVRALAEGYRGLLQARQWLYERGALRSRRLPCPVISIGNLTVGGTGKTPAVRHAVETLVALGIRPAVVSRGYRRRTRGVQVVADGAAILLGPEEGGDEPFLLASRLPGVPVVVGENRYEAGRLAVSRFGVSAIVLDDAFQHRSLVKDVEIVLARARRPWGNARLVPAGPLRETLAALARANLVVATGAEVEDSAAEVEDAVNRYAPGVPVLTAGYAPAESWEAGRLDRTPAAALRGRRLLGFAGIAHPGAFRHTLEEIGVRLTGFEAFADHVRYRRDDLEQLAAHATRTGAEGLVTTEKDWVRVQALPLSGTPLFVVAVRFALRAGEDRWRDALQRPFR